MADTTITRRGFLRGILAAAAASAFPNVAFARGTLQIQYISYEHPLTHKKELVLRVPVRKGVSYALLSSLYTGTESHAGELQIYNKNIKLIYDRDHPHFVVVPQRLLTAVVKRIFDENSWAHFEIDEQGEETGIGTLSDIADTFMVSSIPMQERITVLLILNDDINPISKTVYPGQRILVPESLVNKTDLIDDTKDVAEKETPKQKVLPQKPKPQGAKQNPYRVDVSYIRKRLRARDLFGARRTRSGGRGVYSISRHKGIDLVSPIGTDLFPIEAGTVTEAGKSKNWRNGNIVRYVTNSGLEVTYCHLSKVRVRNGQRITLATHVGDVGITGNANANNPHVHVQVKKNGTVTDPKQYVVIDTPD